MNILIVTGIFEPESGGPAMYAPRIAEKLTETGHHVSVLTYSSHARSDSDARYAFTLTRLVRGNKFLNRIRMFFSVFFRARGTDLVYLLDWFAAGFPASVAARMRGVPYTVRVGGDYLWEQKYLESGAPPVPLSVFYEKGVYQRWRYKVFFWLIRWVLSGAQRVIFNSDKQRKLYEKYYGLQKTSVIYNPVPGITVLSRDDLSERKEFVFWGRFIVMKNLTTLVRAFKKARLPSGYTLTLIGDGPRKKEVELLVSELGLQNKVSVIHTMARGEAWDRVKDSRALILPSWTDISPNIAYEAFAIGLPALITKENYLSISNQLPEMIDPASVDDVASKLEMLADDTRYKKFAEAFTSIKFAHDWDDVVREHMAVFTNVVRKKI